MTTFKKPTIQEIYNTIINDYKTRTNTKVPILKRVLIKCFAYAIAGIVSLIWNFAEWQYLQIFIEICDFEALKRWGNLVDVNYRLGTKAVLKIKLENVSKNEISAGTAWKNLDNRLIYKSLTTINTSTNTNINIDTNTNINNTIINTAKDNTTSTNIFINVECSTSGEIGNLLNDSKLNLINSIAGLPETAIVYSTETIGTENENIEDYRIRILNRYKWKPQGGAAIDYYNWATEVAGIADCLPYVLQNGLITLYIVSNGSGTNRTPTGSIEPNTFPQWQNGQMIDIVGYGQFLSVANSINGDNMNNENNINDNLNNRRPMNAKVQLLPPNYTEYKIEIEDLNPINESIIQNIKNSLIAELDKKRPNIKAIGYSASNATINSNQLNSIVQNIIDSVNGSYTRFALKNKDNKIILNDVLDIGCLAYLGELKINSLNVDI